eukprot:g15099.t1
MIRLCIYVFVLVVLEGRLLGTVHANRRLLSNRLPKKSSHESFLETRSYRFFNKIVAHAAKKFVNSEAGHKTIDQFMKSEKGKIIVGDASVNFVKSEKGEKVIHNAGVDFLNSEKGTKEIDQFMKSEKGKIIVGDAGVDFLNSDKGTKEIRNAPFYTQVEDDLKKKGKRLDSLHSQSREVIHSLDLSHKATGEILTVVNASKTKADEVHAAASGQLAKLRRTWASEDVRIKYEKLLAARGKIDAEANKNDCITEKAKGISIFPAVVLDEEVDDKSCINRNRDELVEAFCNFRNQGFDSFLSQHGLNNGKYYWKNICCKSKTLNNTEKDPCEISDVPRENIVPFALVQGGPLTFSSLYGEVKDMLKKDGYLHRGMITLLNSVKKDKANGDKIVELQKIVNITFKKTSLCGPRTFHSPRSKEVIMCELFYPYNHLLTEFQDSFRTLFPNEGSETSSFLQVMKARTKYFGRSKEQHAVNMPKQTQHENFCRGGIKVYDRCDLGNIAHEPTAFWKGKGITFAKMVGKNNKLFDIPSGCKVTLYSSAIDSIYETNIQNLTNHALIIKGPKQFCAMHTLSGMPVKFIGIEDDADLEEIFGDVEAMKREISEIKKQKTGMFSGLKSWLVSFINNNKALKGHKGDRGSKGDVGKQGERGMKGDKGKPGIVGERGARGATGKSGERGDDGIGLRLKVFNLGQTYHHGDYVFAKSSKGQYDSMYIAEKETFVATKSPYLDLNSGNWVEFHAPRGIAGDKGERGLKGEKGERGLKGEKGTNGKQGPQGERGLNGTTGLDGESKAAKNSSSEIREALKTRSIDVNNQVKSTKVGALIQSKARVSNDGKSTCPRVSGANPAMLNKYKEAFCRRVMHVALHLPLPDVNVAMVYVQDDMAPLNKIATLAEAAKYVVRDGCSSPLFNAEDISLQKIDTGKNQEWVSLIQLDTTSRDGYIQKELANCKKLPYVPQTRVVVNVEMPKRCDEKECVEYIPARYHHNGQPLKYTIDITGTSYEFKRSHMKGRRRRLLAQQLSRGSDGDC